MRKVLLFLFCYWFAASAMGQWHKETAAVMGTTIYVELWQADAKKAKQAIEQVFAEMRRIDELLSPYKPRSRLSRINQQAANKAVFMDDETRLIVEESLKLSRQTKGAFDITFSSVGVFYDYRRKIKPSTKQIKQHLSAINYKNIVIEDKSYIRFTHADTKIDLGGIAKGYAIDQSIKILKGLGIKYAYVSAGGDSYVLGDKRGRPWNVGVQHPRLKNKVVLVLPLADTAVSTSGDYERFFVDGDDERHHHILNPKTGTSVKGIHSVTVIGPQAMQTDGLSTSVFVLGIKKGLTLIENTKAAEVIIVDAKGGIQLSSGLSKLGRVIKRR